MNDRAQSLSFNYIQVRETREMTQDPSRWWYALLPFPVLVGLRYGLVWLTMLVLPAAGPSRSEALPVLLLGLGASLVGALVVASAPLFIAGLILDVRTLRNHATWTPHWGIAALGILPLLGLVVKWTALVSIPAMIGYLGLRRSRTGYPFGQGQASDDETTTAIPQSSTQLPSSQWWFGVVIPPALELAGGLAVWIGRTTELISQGSEPLSLLLPVALILLAGGLVPVFALSLYLNAKTVSSRPDESRLDPRVWGLLGLGSLAGLVLFRVTLMPLIALVYLLQRRMTTGPE